MESPRIGVAIMLHDMDGLIQPCIKSVNWADSIYIFDDHCMDRSIEGAQDACETRLVVEKSPFDQLAFQYGETQVRNYVIDNAFEKTGADVLVLLDADEMMSDLIRPVILSAFTNRDIDSIAMNIWHLFDRQRYFHIWKTCINGIRMIDPHLRIIKKGLRYKARFDDGSHPAIKITKKTLCVNGAYHFHLKYYNELDLSNYSLHFLPEHLKEEDCIPYLRKLDFALPDGIRESLNVLERSKGRVMNDFAHHQEKRTRLERAEDALIHPRDKKTL